MKILLLIAVVLFGVWLWRSRREDGAPRPVRKPPAPAPAQQMVQCRHCAVHLPLADARQGRLGPYCCDEHLRLDER